MAMENGALERETEAAARPGATAVGPGTSAAAPDPQWGGDLLDLDAYLRRIGYEGPRTATVETLFDLHRMHKAAIAFENLDVALERGVSLQLDDVQRKLVDSGRGGYCFEHNLLFAAVLERLGFPVTRLLARVRLGRRQIRYRAHTVLAVGAGYELWLADAGFGAEGLIEPVPLHSGSVAKAGAWSWRVLREVDQWVLQTLRDGDWFDLYAFRVEQHFPPDFEVSNHYTAHHARSAFTGKVVAMRGTEDVQQTLRDRELTTRHADDVIERTALTADEVVDLLRGTFAIRLTDRDAHLLRRRLAFLASQGASKSPKPSPTPLQEA
ncbi:arylamine N-acetyltransferase family protein [Streptomyces aureocirculatus]|uniref:arylamine N-acetyltransferase family protein n=1 Tax=Streptomyces aureocirculatus TaxID=67275 RepID=UPI001CEDB6E8|nr:arylamine N-acetyltransferase [Streptomyces aureocirculatus]